uniref:B30.2/SPRY domain-containing protein n=1 Tax=Seriola dumerili TaxID=41447 RepID=A0A3B4V2C9_SERDU
STTTSCCFFAAEKVVSGRKMKEKVHFSPSFWTQNTANPRLHLSDDLTSVRLENTKQRLPDNPERHSVLPIVLGSEGFSSGKHSWEVEVGDHPVWTVGLTKESVDRKGEIFVSPEYGNWCLFNRSGKYINGVSETVTVKKSLQRIRVQLDYDRGKVQGCWRCNGVGNVFLTRLEPLNTNQSWFEMCTSYLSIVADHSINNKTQSN